MVMGMLVAACATQPPVTAARANLKLYVFDCGKIRLNRTEMFSVGSDETSVRVLAVPCYMIEHEAGRLLWDGGIVSSMADVSGWQGEGIEMRLDRTLSAQLADLDLDMRSFDYMAFSHMHSDHVGVANEIDGATLLIQRTEYEVQFADVVDPRGGVNPALYERLREAPTILLDGDHDVFGDGSVRIISAPGHTPGHQVLLVNLVEYGPVLIGGDLYHFAFSRRHRRVPTFNVDPEMTLASMDRVEALVAETGATLWIEHELALFERQRHAPEYYH
jgi:glyoxylase-like metal-dependent hydrolase (beta-lactamase superfamily II)